MEELRKKFKKVYSNLPLGIRKEIILVVGKEPVTWSVIWLEVDQRTETGNEMLRLLKKLRLI